MFHHLRTLVSVAFVGAMTSFPVAVQAADRDDVENFLKVTGFDVALESIALGAETAPSMLGLEDNAFGQTWSNLVKEVFIVEDMNTQALDILEATLDQNLLDHAVTFYGSELGQRLVHAENLSHLDDDELKQVAGEQLLAFYEAKEDPRPAYFVRMGAAIDPENIGLQALQTIQVRFILAASRAGVIARDIDEEALWANIRANEAEVLAAIEEGAKASAAYTYQDFTADEVKAYTEALEHPDMQLVYELMNAVHYQVMGNRFEALSLRLGELQPSQDL
ncbi:DUF2059 domain-containing protein [Cognatishimia sp.]|uniref:DUF2059 domain-containing protein n=1 Tax=Cognatishimia sp. TaxID=2211648 RepID=UPI003517A517